MDIDDINWGATSPGRLIQMIQSINWADEKLPPFIEARTNGLATYGFQTRKGGIGMLQITGSSKRPVEVRIRHKVVQ